MVHRAATTRAFHQRSSNSDSLRHPARELARIITRKRSKPDLLQYVVGQSATLLCSFWPETELHILTNIEPWHQSRLLKHNTERGIAPVIPANPARCRSFESGEHTH